MVGSWLFLHTTLSMLGKILLQAWSWCGGFNKEHSIFVHWGQIFNENILYLALNEPTKNALHSNLHTKSKHVWKTYPTWKALYAKEQTLIALPKLEGLEYVSWASTRGLTWSLLRSLATMRCLSAGMMPMRANQFLANGTWKNPPAAVWNTSPVFMCQIHNQYIKIATPPISAKKI